MKSKSIATTVGSATLLGAGLAWLVASCATSPQITQVINCPKPGPTETNVAIDDAGADPSWMVSSTTCLVDNPCLTSEAGSAYPCQVHTGFCDTAPTVQKCKLKLQVGKQCVPGSMRACTTLTAGRGILRCAGNCDFPSPAIGGCVACGADTQPCCIGGCDPGHYCKGTNNQPDPNNDAGSKCAPWP